MQLREGGADRAFGRFIVGLVLSRRAAGLVDRRRGQLTSSVQQVPIGRLGKNPSLRPTKTSPDPSRS